MASDTEAAMASGTETPKQSCNGAAKLSGSGAEESVAQQSQPPSFFRKNLSSKTIEVIVGDEGEKEVFVTYRDLLVHWVLPWRNLAKVKAPTVRLPSVHPRVFRVFLDWMLSDGNKLPQWDVRKPTDETLESPMDIDDDAQLEEEFDDYYRKQPEAEALDCYIFATEYGIRLFQNDIFDSMIEMNPEYDVVPSYSIVIQAWEKLPSTSPMRKYLVDLFARNWYHDADVGHYEELVLRRDVPSTFWISLLSQKDEHGELDDYPPWEEDRCQYHVHEGTEREECEWQKINDGRGYRSDDTDGSVSDLDEYESDFIDDGKPEVVPKEEEEEEAEMTDTDWCPDSDDE